MPDGTGEMDRYVEELITLAKKRAISSGGIIPSMDFNTDAYLQFLQFATPYELENDILSQNTVKVMAEYNTPGLSN